MCSSVLDVVATMLEELGCHVETAHTGADALNRLCISGDDHQDFTAHPGPPSPTAV